MSTPSLGAKNRALVLTAMIFAVAMTFIDQTIVSIAAPSIIENSASRASGVQWAVNAYLLALAAFFAFGGRLSDTIGHRRMVVVGMRSSPSPPRCADVVPAGDSPRRG